MKVGAPIGCLDGRTSRYERRQNKVAIDKLLSKQNLIKILINLAIYWRRMAMAAVTEESIRSAQVRCCWILGPLLDRAMHASTGPAEPNSLGRMQGPFSFDVICTMHARNTCTCMHVTHASLAR